MSFAVFVTTPRSGMGYAVAPYTVELKTLYATRAEAQAVADAKSLPAGAKTVLDAMPSLYAAWAAGVAYATGAYCSYGGKSWRCLQGHTAIVTWEPVNVPALWTVVEAPGLSAWQSGVSYSLPSQRTYSGRLYELLQAHTSQVGWEPPNVPALWSDIGTSVGVPAYTRALWTVVSTDEPDYSQIERGHEP